MLFLKLRGVESLALHTNPAIKSPRNDACRGDLSLSIQFVKFRTVWYINFFARYRYLIYFLLLLHILMRIRFVGSSHGNLSQNKILAPFNLWAGKRRLIWQIFSWLSVFFVLLRFSFMIGFFHRLTSFPVSSCLKLTKMLFWFLFFFAHMMM